jgi:hypothetical protein
MRHRTLLEYKGFRYLKLVVILMVASVAAYIWHRPPVGPYGGTWLGYTLGTIGALIILLLTWFGVRKRQYSASAATLQGWLSAHVYLGLSLIVVATLHTGFEVGWNVHTLAYVLMLIVIFSGFYGMYAYIRYPRLVTDNLGEDSLDSLFLKIAAQDNEARRIAVQLPDHINRAVLAAAQGTRIGGGLFKQLAGHVANCPTTAAVDLIRESGRELKGEEAKLNHELYAAMLHKQTLVERARTDIKYKARMAIWLYIHVPLSIALLAALIAHVVSVFYYW